MKKYKAKMKSHW